MTFNPKEPYSGDSEKINKDTLYWEYHSDGTKKHPDLFREKRKKAIFSTSVSFLRNISKSEFKVPSSKSKVFHKG